MTTEPKEIFTTDNSYLCSRCDGFAKWSNLSNVVSCDRCHFDWVEEHHEIEAQEA